MSGRAARWSAVRGCGIAGGLNERGRWRKTRGTHSHDLEEAAHAGRRDQALYASLDSAGLLGIGGHQPGRSLGCPKAAEKLGLGERPIDGEPGFTRLVREGREVD